MIQCKNSGISESFDIIVRNFCPSNYEQGLQKIKVACLGGLKATYLTRQAWTACKPPNATVESGTTRHFLHYVSNHTIAISSSTQTIASVSTILRCK